MFESLPSIETHSTDVKKLFPDVNVIEKPMDKRSPMVDRKQAPRQVLCYVCCAEFGTNSFPIHLKTCLKKHDWGLTGIANDETVHKKVATANRKKCSLPGDPPSKPLPHAKDAQDRFDEYNEEAQAIFFAHAEQCLWCRTQNVEAMAAAKRAEEDARRRAAEEEAARLARERADEEARARAAAEEAARLRGLHEDEERRRALENEMRRMLEEQARKRAEEEVARWLDEEARRQLLAAEIAEAEERRKRLLAQGKRKYLKKGEGQQAATESGHVHERALKEEKAKHDIAYYSINHAKKEGLVVDRPLSAPRDEPEVVFKEVEVVVGSEEDVGWNKQWTPEQEAEFAASTAAPNRE